MSVIHMSRITSRNDFTYRLFTTLALPVFFIILSVSVQQFSLELPNKIQDTITLTLGIVYEALPFVVLGVLLSAIVQAYLKTRDIEKILPKNRFLKKVSLASIGIFLPVCECGNVPLNRGLLAKGVKPADSLSFLLAAPIVSPITIITTLIAFSDPSVAVIRTLGGLSIALLISYAFSSKGEVLLTQKYQAFCDASKNQKPSTQNYKERMRALSRNFVTEINSLLPALITGSFLAGIIQTTVPRSALLYVSNQPIIAILVLLVLAFVVSICANVDAFFALALSAIFPMSAIIAFLLFGPLVDIKILSMLSTTYRKEVLVKMSAIAFLMSFIIALGAHYVI